MCSGEKVKRGEKKGHGIATLGKKKNKFGLFYTLIKITMSSRCALFFSFIDIKK